MEQMTVTRGLAKLKLLDSRIKKEIVAACLCDLYQEKADRAIRTGFTKKEFESKAKASLESITALMVQRRAIKSAILRSNAETNVVIAEEAMSVAEAIERKNSIEYDKLLLGKMLNDLGECMTRAEESRVEIEGRVRVMLESNLSSETKADADTYNKIAGPFIRDNQLKILDPLELKNKKRTLDKTIDEFTSEVDFILSESNSRTEIEV